MARRKKRKKKAGNQKLLKKKPEIFNPLKGDASVLKKTDKALGKEPDVQIQPDHRQERDENQVFLEALADVKPLSGRKNKITRYPDPNIKPAHPAGSDELEALCSLDNDTTYVVNFWATWCSPCVKEIGFFEELHRKPPASDLKVILVSLDFPNSIDRRVLPFLKEKDITAEVHLVTDLDYNAWIERIDPDWTGAIPATLIYNRQKRLFVEKELSRDELVEHVTQILN